ncbi:MAG TPA: putative LPS assembly protein LptD [Ignavibacteriaceae bacterium]|nr:putative LPS assembly protein LptD [Ignavibacteriaceae bacterium]
MKSNLKILFLIVLNLYFLQTSIYSQQIDSLFISSDSLITNIDSLQTEKPKGKTFDVDTTVFASSKDSLIFLVKNKKMKIYGEGNISYKTTEIKSANIFIDFNSNEIDAEGIPSDSLPESLIGTPILKEGSEVYEGKTMKYNFKSGRGLLSLVKTEMDGSYYTGEKINKVDKDTYFIEDGLFTTCDDSSCPHYYFTASKMKVIHKQQLVAEWIFINFGGVPLPIPLPFAVFPIESGRRSGIIPPAFGSDATYGTYFSRFGYFWAINDYMDLNVTADYYTRGSYKLDSRYRYTKRYTYSGNVEASYGKFIQGELTDLNHSERNDWRLRINHNQTLTPTSRLDAKLEFLSGNNINRNVTDFNEVLRTEAVSNATYFKQWEESGNSLSLSYSRTQNFQNNNISEILPNLNFSLAQSYPFRGNTGAQKWYETFGYSYSGQFQNNRNKVDGDLKIRGGIQHNISASLSPKIGYFSISPNFRYNESWYNKQITKSTAYNDTGAYYIKTDDVNKISQVRTFSMGLSASTKFYGMFNINALGVNAVRHIVTPSLSYNYAPDFSTPFWGYYDSYKDSSGNVVEYSKFEREILGKPNEQESQSIGFNITNAFEMKTNVNPNDTTSKENKFKLLNLVASMSYNFAGKSYKFSNLQLSYQTQIGNLLSIQGSSILSPYDYDDKNDKIDRYLISNGKGLLRLTNTNFSISLSLSGDKIASSETDNTTTVQQDQYLQASERSIYQGLYNDKEADFSIPWDISLNYYYNLSRPVPSKENTSSSVSGSLNFNLTPKWKFSVTGSYDLKQKEFAAPQIRISRDLHCWTMSFTWNPIGSYRGYNFEIRVKAPQLQDLKITKRDQFYDGR